MLRVLVKVVPLAASMRSSILMCAPIVRAAVACFECCPLSLATCACDVSSFSCSRSCCEEDVHEICSMVGGVERGFGTQEGEGAHDIECIHGGVGLKKGSHDALFSLEAVGVVPTAVNQVP